MVSATGASEIDQRLPGPGGTYAIAAEIRRLSPGGIRLHDVTLYGASFEPILTTSVNIRPGQTLVLGSSPQGDGNATLLLTVRAEEM